MTELLKVKTLDFRQREFSVDQEFSLAIDDQLRKLPERMRIWLDEYEGSQ